MPFQANSTLTCTQLGWTFIPQYGTCGHSSQNMGGCLTSATWLQAQQRCSEYGARLCSRNELMAAEGTGCGIDGELIWTWDECGHGTPGNQRVAARGNNDKIYSCEEAYFTHAVRCCAD